MKKILIIFGISFLLFGCSKDILELTPLDKLSETNVWADETLVGAYVDAQYNALVPGFANNTSKSADEAYNQLESFMRNLRTLNGITAENTITPLNYWNTGYTYIRNINIFFEKIDASATANNFSAANVASFKAQMQFMRAYIYFRLLNSYGGVPIITESFGVGDDYASTTRNSYDEVRDYILADLNAVIASSLPDKQTGANAGRASRDAARAMKAKLLLYDASAYHNPSNDLTKWTAASNAAWEIINSNRYSLYNDFFKLFTTDGNSEIIFQKYYSTTNSHNYPFFNCPVALGGYGVMQPTVNLADAFEMTNGQLPYLEGGDRLNPTINPAASALFDPQKPFLNRDPRFYSTFAYNTMVFDGKTILTYEGAVTQDRSYTGFYSLKFLKAGDAYANSLPYTTPWIFYRLADVYLMYAECQAKLGNDAVAREYVNKVRSRPGVAMPAITESGDALYNRILHERQVELALEDNRYFDIRRTKTAPVNQLEPIVRYWIVKEGSNYTYSRQELLPGFWQDAYYLLPIPYTERVKAPQIEQNPGYNDGVN